MYSARIKNYNKNYVIQDPWAIGMCGEQIDRRRERIIHTVRGDFTDQKFMGRSELEPAGYLARHKQLDLGDWDSRRRKEN